MSFTLSIDKGLPVGTFLVVIRSPEFGDTTRMGRRQAVGETEAGRQFIQDQGVDREFFDATWTNLNLQERRNLELFFSDAGVNYRQRPFFLGVVDNKCFALPLNTGQGYNTGADLNTGDLTFPTSGSFGEVRLEQSELGIQAISRDRYTASLRFRILKPGTC